MNRFVDRQRGFTLLEILVALSVLSIVVVAAVNNAGTTIGNLGYLRDRTLAHWVAMNKAAELEVADEWPQLGTRRGVETMADRRWEWTVTGHRTPDPDVRRAEIEVGPADDDTVLATLTVYIGRPQEKKGA